MNQSFNWNKGDILYNYLIKSNLWHKSIFKKQSLDWMHFVIKSYDSFFAQKKFKEFTFKRGEPIQIWIEISRICLLDRHSPMQKIIVLNSKCILV